MPNVRPDAFGLAGRALALGAATAGGAAEVLAAASALAGAGRDVVRLEVGEPDFPTPAHVVEAGVRALRDGRTRYGPAAGIPELRAAVAESLRVRGVAADPARVVVAPGAKAAIFAALLAAVRPGDEVLVPDPGYPAYAGVAEFAGARAVRYPLGGPGGTALDADAVAARVTPRTRVLVLNLPGNPTGAVADAAALDAVAELADRHDLLVVSDEIYARHVYPPAAGRAPHARGVGPPAAAPSVAARAAAGARTVVVDGFSKTYAMTGWRLGYALVPPPLVAGVTALLASSASCTATFVQHAGVAALAGPQDGVAAAVAELRCRRDYLVAALGALPGVRCATPAGAFYAFPDVRAVLARTGEDTGALARRLLHGHGLACVPGDAFGPGGVGHLRLAYTAPVAELARAVARLRAAIEDGIAAVDTPPA